MTDPDTSVEWTGERLVTTCRRPLVFEHLHRYAIGCALSRGKRVLDIACGEGYGAYLISRTAESVLGVDIDAGVTAHAAAKYPRPNLKFAQGTCEKIPCEDHSVDLVASFETIEHLTEHGSFLEELKRVLAPGGILVISSPDKIEYNRISGTPNRFHFSELTHHEFLGLLHRNFAYCLAGKQRLVLGSWIAPDEITEKTGVATFFGNFERLESERGVRQGVYSIAICSDSPLPEVDLGLFEDARLSARIWSLLDTETAETTGLSGDAARHVEILQRQLEEKTQQVMHFKQESENQAGIVSRLHSHLQMTEERLDRITHQFLEARWENLTARRHILRPPRSASGVPLTVDLQNRAEQAEGERDRLREMATWLHAELETIRHELQLLKQRTQRVRNSLGFNLLRPFSSAHRKFYRVTKLE